MTFAVLWASQTSTNQPTKRYSFRLAAYNSAGMSPFLYYDLDLKQKSLQKFLTAGNQLLEISLVGGGVVSNNVSVHFVTPGTTDFTKGKECRSAQLLDQAGTWLTCRTPVVRICIPIGLRLAAFAAVVACARAAPVPLQPL